MVQRNLIRHKNYSYSHIVLPLFTNRWRISGSRGRKSHGAVKTWARKCGVWYSTWGTLQGWKMPGAKQPWPLFLTHLAMNEKQITKILYISHDLLGSFSDGKLLNTKGEQSRYLFQCHGRRIMQLIYPEQLIGSVCSFPVLWHLLATSTAASTGAQITCVMFPLHSADTEHAVKSCSPHCHLSVPELGDSKCHLRKAQGLWWVIILGNMVWGCVTSKRCSDCGFESECHCPIQCPLHVEEMLWV